MTDDETIKSVVWMGSSRRDLQEFPKEVRTEMGHALYAAQRGETDPAAKPLKGFGGTRVMEITDRYDTNTYRTVYIAQLASAVYVLHAFQKKSTHGIATPHRELDVIRQRFADAERLEKSRRR